MTADEWVAVPVGDVRAGDRLRLASGTEMTVSRIEAAFLGYDDLVCFVEDSDAQWLAQAMWMTSEIEVRR
jgi:hypothetical protein